MDRLMNVAVTLAALSVALLSLTILVLAIARVLGAPV